MGLRRWIVESLGGVWPEPPGPPPPSDEQIFSDQVMSHLAASGITKYVVVRYVQLSWRRGAWLIEVWPGIKPVEDFRGAPEAFIYADGPALIPQAAQLLANHFLDLETKPQRGVKVLN